jgi:nucleoside-diphosphate-sugar epimerase
MRILVTGANGLVGRALCSTLAGRGVVLRAATRLAQPDLVDLDVVSTGDINAQTNWLAALSGISIVVHLAARVHVMHERSANPLAEFRRVNVQGTLNLARQAAAAGVQRLVFVSSVKVNGEQTLPGQPFTEADAPAPQDAYGQSKYEAEQGLRQIAEQTGLEVVIIRAPLVYGPGVKANFAALMRAVRHDWPLPLGRVHNLRSLVALDNLVDFIVTCATHRQAANQTFLVSDAQDVSTPELVRAMAQALNQPARLLPVPVWLLQSAAGALGQAAAMQRLCGNLQLDISKARSVLGWHPCVTIQQGLQKMCHDCY